MLTAAPIIASSAVATVILGCCFCCLCHHCHHCHLCRRCQKTSLLQSITASIEGRSPLRLLNLPQKIQLCMRVGQQIGGVHCPKGRHCWLIMEGCIINEGGQRRGGLIFIKDNSSGWWRLAAVFGNGSRHRQGGWWRRSGANVWCGIIVSHWLVV